MYKIRIYLKENINLPYGIIYYISTFLKKDDIFFEDKKNENNNNFIVEFILRQRYKNKIEHKII